MRRPSTSPADASTLGLRLLPWLPLLTYAALAAVLWTPFQYIMWKDEINFITIAERYARGDWASAPNAFWPPLLSWLQALTFWIGIPTAAAVKLLSVLIGAFAFAALQRLLRAFEVGPRMRFWASLAIVPGLLYSALFAAVPDLLLASLLCLYWSIVLRAPTGVQRASRAAWCGLTGALAYFCKGYALYFFLAHFGLVILWNLLTSGTVRERRRLLNNAAIGLGVLLVPIAMWVIAVHRKYGVATLGVVGPYNYAMRGPAASGQPPTQYVGFVPPPSTATVSVWEEPYYLYRMLKPWMPLERGALMHQLRLIRANLVITMTAFNGFTVFWAAIIFGTLLLWLGPAPAHLRSTLGLGLAAMALYPAGYALIHTEDRYLWPVQMLLVCFAALLMQQLWHAEWLRVRWPRWPILALVGLSFMVHPMMELRARANGGKAIDALCNLFARELPGGARIASNWEYAGSVLLAYRARARYYGQPKPDAAIAEVERELVRHGIEYYLVWDGIQIESPILEKRKDLTAGSRTVAIYAVRRPTSRP